MKKIFILIVLVITLTGCMATNELSTSAVPNQDNVKQLNTTNQYEELANNLPDKNMLQPDKVLHPEAQPNLLKDYKSAIIKTNMGDITVEFFNDDAPITINNFMYLAQQGFYNNTLWHRVIKDFMIQGGDPLSKESDISKHGTGGPNYRFKDEINDHKLIKGSLAMANAGPGTNGSQFFIVTAESTPWLDGKHTNFGKVIVGMDIVNKINNVATGAADHPIDDIIVQEIILQ